MGKELCGVGEGGIKEIYFVDVKDIDAPGLVRALRHGSGRQFWRFEPKPHQLKKAQSVVRRLAALRMLNSCMTS